MIVGGVPSPAEMLIGMTLPDGWFVESAITLAPKATGGHFSSSYLVRRDDTRAFLKALDFVAALNAPDPSQALADLTNAYLFERDLLKRCEQQRMSHVVQVIADGTVHVPNGGPIPRVSYLIFELAEGDIRHFRMLSAQIDVAWAFRSLHNATLGVQQLHARGIAHQDLKPSNLLTFHDGKTAKLGDLGRASVQGQVGPHDGFAVAGDATYAPLEAFYGYVPTDWGERRRACDLYHLGSLLLFQFTGVTATSAVFSELPKAYWPSASGGSWKGRYQDVVLYLRDAVGKVVSQLPRLDDDYLDSRLRSCILELCEPDPKRRGHPRNHSDRYGDPYSVVRYVSAFAGMAARAEGSLVKIAVP